MSVDWSRLRAIAEEALALHGDARARFIRERCADAPELAAEVESLVAAARRDDSFLEPGIERVGAYSIERVIASGGMGTVYEARRADPDRRVALKLMRAGISSDGRFRYEMEVLAHLKHPNIAHLYETGEHGPARLPWFAMELVEGAQPITNYAARHGLPLDERIRLFVKVCDAVHHGHQRGVLHRDLKPDNILVDGEGVPKVIDFGVARATGADRPETMQTRLGEIVGTLAFMSPEQVAGESSALDVRSDIYALGIVLYQLVTGDLPYDLGGCNLVEAARVIREARPRPMPVGGDLATITLKCLEKEPDRRYASVADLGAELRRYLAREPIAAHPPSLVYHVRMFARRHRAIVLSGALVFTVAVVAAIVSLVLLGHAREAERTTRALFDASLDRNLETTLRFVPRIRQLAGGAPLAIDLTKATLEDLERLEAISHDDPEVLRSLGWAYLNLGEVQGDPRRANNLGDRAAALASYERALAVVGRLEGDRFDDLRAEAMSRTALLGFKERGIEESMELMDAAAAIATRLVERRPDEPDAAEARLGVLLRRSMLVARSGAEAESGALRRDALAIARAAAERWPEHYQLRLVLASALNGVAVQTSREGDNPGSRRLHEEAARELLWLIEQRADDVRPRFELGYTYMQLGCCARFDGELDESAALLDRGCAVLEELQAEDPANVRVPRLLGMVYAERAATSRTAAEASDDPVPHLEAASRAYARAAEVYRALDALGKGTRGHGGFVKMFDDERARCDADLARAREGGD